jgi:hypothetical protein
VLFLTFASLVLAAGNFKFNVRNPTTMETTEEAERQVVLVQDPVIFGLDMLGWGVDLRASLPSEGSIKVPIYKWEFTEGSTYLYPLEPETTFSVPDEVFVRTVAEMQGTNYFFNTRDEYLTQLHIGIGLGIKASAKKNSEEGSNPTSGNQTGSLDSTDLGAFSGDVSVTYNKKNLATNEMLMIENTLESGLWQLVVGPAIFPRERISQKIQEIAEASGPEQYDAMLEFIDRHGTHFVDSVIVGGHLKMSSLTKKSQDLDATELAILANFGFKNMFGLDEGNLSLNITFVDKAEQFEQETTNQLDVLGGDPELANFFRGDLKPEETFVNWSRTLIRNPAVIRTRCREISWLFGPLRAEVSLAVEDYLAGRAPF